MHQHPSLTEGNLFRQSQEANCGRPANDMKHRKTHTVLRPRLALVGRQTLPLQSGRTAD
jgi:hypothetical protein